jgi:chromosome segregation ATPase
MTDDLMAEAADALVAKDAEIARLRAENERLTGERDEARKAGGEARISENKAEHARVSMSLRVTKLEANRTAIATRVAELEAENERWKERAHLAEGAVAVLNRTIDDLNGEHDALAQRVAEAVRCRALLIVDLRDRARIRAIDLGPIVAAALKESAP